MVLIDTTHYKKEPNLGSFFFIMRLFFLFYFVLNKGFYAEQSLFITKSLPAWIVNPGYFYKNIFFIAGFSAIDYTLCRFAYFSINFFKP